MTSSDTRRCAWCKSAMPSDAIKRVPSRVWGAMWVCADRYACRRRYMAMAVKPAYVTKVR